MVRLTYTPPPPPPLEGPAVIPLTHHEILSLVGPFAERGRHVDLPASDRANREIAFRAVEHPAAGDDTPALREVLRLAVPEPGWFRLVRILTEPGGVSARLSTEGSDAAALLAEIEAMPPARQFSIRAGVPVARSYRIQPRPPNAPDDAPARQLQMLGAEAHIAGVRLSVNTKTGLGLPAELELRALNEQALVVPQDLLAVLGWEWRPLRRFSKSWRGSIRIAKQEPERSRDAEIKINRTVEHLVETLGQAPADFHARYHGARWRVTFQRAVPLLTGLSLLAVTPLVGLLEMEDQSIFRMLIFHAPPIMMFLMFRMPEMPVIEVPPLPRPLTFAQWMKG